MSVIDVVSDVTNTFLSRREITCNFRGLGGRLNKVDAVDMVSKEFNLDNKITIPIRMSSHVGKPLLTGTFYVYGDEDLARRQVNPVILKRFDTAKKKAAESSAKPVAETPAETVETSVEPAVASDDSPVEKPKSEEL